jgi:Tn3 transposase DDE domain
VSRRQLARTVVDGKRGELRHHYREGEEDQFGTVKLLVNMVIPWNAIYMDAALGQRQSGGMDVRDEDAAQLSPFANEHINVLRRYVFVLPEVIARRNSGPSRFPQPLTTTRDKILT